MSERANQLLERIAVAVERLAEDPVIQMETAPPVCPHCETVNPNVSTEDKGGAGPMAEFVIRFTCLNCNHVFYAIPVQWTSVPEISQLEQVLEQHKEISGYGDNGNHEHS